MKFSFPDLLLFAALHIDHPSRSMPMKNTLKLTPCALSAHIWLSPLTPNPRERRVHTQVERAVLREQWG